MKLQLFSDYADFYDYFFESKYELIAGSLRERTDFSGEVKPFYRYASLGHGLSKTEQFKQLKKMDFQVIQNTECWNLELSENKKVVVYLEEFAHAGNGKILTSVANAKKNYPDFRCSWFQRTHENENMSVLFKRIVIGNHKFEFKISCLSQPEDPDSWGTNNAIDTNIILLDHDECENKYRPIYGIDFVKSYLGESRKGSVYAIDLNWAPGLHGLKIDEFYSGKEIVKMIIDWCEENNWISTKE